MPNPYEFKIPAKRLERSRVQAAQQDDEPTGEKKSEVEGITRSSLEDPKDRLERAAMQLKNGRKFSDPEDAVKFLKENRRENLFVQSLPGMNAFLVRASYELAEAGQKVLFLFDGHLRRHGDVMKKKREKINQKWHYEFFEQAQECPVRKAMVCENLEEIKDDRHSVHEAVGGAKILVGNLHQKWFVDLIGDLIDGEVFVPDTVILSGLEWTAPETFLKFLEHWQFRIIGGFNPDVNGRETSAAEFVKASGDQLNCLILPPKEGEENPFPVSERSRSIKVTHYYDFD